MKATINQTVKDLKGFSLKVYNTTIILTETGNRTFGEEVHSEIKARTWRLGVPHWVCQPAHGSEKAEKSPPP